MASPVASVGNNQELELQKQEKTTVSRKTSDTQVDLPRELSGQTRRRSSLNAEPQHKSVGDLYFGFINGIESLFPRLKSKPHEEKHGKISFGEKVTESLVGIAQIFTTMLKNPIQTLVGVAAFAAIMSFMGPLAPLVIAAGFTIGTIKAINCFNKGENAKTDEEARKAYRGFGASLFTAISSLCGARAAVKTAKANGVGTSIDPDKVTNPFRNLIECFRLSLGGNKGGSTNIYGAVGHSWHTKWNKYTTDQVKSKYATKLEGDVASKKTAKETAQKALDKAKDKLQSAQDNYTLAQHERKRAQEMMIGAEERLQQIEARLAENIQMSQRAALEQSRTMAYGQANAGNSLDWNNANASLGQTRQMLQIERQAYDPSMLAQSNASSIIRVRHAETKLTQAKEAFTKAEADFNKASGEFTTAETAQKAAEDAPSFLGSLADGFSNMIRTYGLFQ